MEDSLEERETRQGTLGTGEEREAEPLVSRLPTSDRSMESMLRQREGGWGQAQCKKGLRPSCPIPQVCASYPRALL